MSRVRVGVIGVGWWSARVHLPALAAHPDADVAAVCDVDIQRAQAVAARYDVPVAVDTTAALLEAGVDAVVVATPQHAHAAPAAAALDAGIDVLVEKPMTVDPDEAWDLVQRAGRSGARLHVGYPFPYTRHAEQAHAALASGASGDLLLATGLFATATRPLLAMPASERTVLDGDIVGRGGGTYSDPAHGGQALSQATHAVALLLWLTGMRPAAVTAMLHRGGLAVDLVDALSIRADTGAVLSIASTGSVERHEQRIEEYRLFLEHGHIELDTAGGTLAFDGGSPDQLPESDIYPAHAPACRLVDAVLGRAPVLVGGELGATTTSVIAAALRSASTGIVEEITLAQPQSAGPRSTA